MSYPFGPGGTGGDGTVRRKGLQAVPQTATARQAGFILRSAVDAAAAAR